MCSGHPQSTLHYRNRPRRRRKNKLEQGNKTASQHLGIFLFFVCFLLMPKMAKNQDGYVGMFGSWEHHKEVVTGLKKMCD